MCVHVEGSLGLGPAATSSERSKAFPGSHIPLSGKAKVESRLGALPGHG